MGLVCRRNQHFGMLRARQQLLELLVLARLGVDLGDALEGKTCLLDTTPLRARGFLNTAKLLRGRARRLKAGAVTVKCLERRTARPCIHHGNMVRRIKQALMFMLTAKVHHHTHALRKLTHAGDAAVNFYPAAALGRKAALHREAFRVVRTVEQTRLDARQRLALAHRR